MTRWARWSRGTHATYRFAAVLTVVLVIFGLVSLRIFERGSAAPVRTSLSVTSGADDARSPDSGDYSASEQAALIGTGDGRRSNVAGFRFNNVQVPPGAIIDSVQFSLVKATTQWQRLMVELAFEDTDNAAAFSASQDPDSRSMTSAGTRVNDNAKRMSGRRYVLGEQSDLAESLQEVVDRQGWRSGNSVVLLAWGDASPPWARVDFATADAGSRYAPQLVVTYHLEGSGSPSATSTTTARPPATSTDVPPTSTAPSSPTATTTAPGATATTVPPTATTAAPTTVPPTATAVPPTATAITPGSGDAVAGQPCPAWVHDRYQAQGPDGQWYPTWHPPVDAQYGCYFGHEHGDNPNGSPALRGRTPLFGYASIAAGMDEPHTGFKVFRWDNIQSSNGPQHNGAAVLMVLHQGTSGAGRFTTVHHDVEVHYYNPRDGREIHVHMLAPFGDLLVGCGANDPGMVLRQEQANVPGARQVAADKCFNLPKTPYEDWITALYVGVDSTGNWKAYLDPHFAVFNPNTYCIVQNGQCTLGYSDVRDGTGADPASQEAKFKGTKREAYLNQVWIKNQGGSTSVWTDPYGRLAAPNAPGAIEQYISTVYFETVGNSTAFGADRIHDPSGTVHAPN